LKSEAFVSFLVDIISNYKFITDKYKFFNNQYNLIKIDLINLTI